jgi:hypothetical protein
MCVFRRGQDNGIKPVKYLPMLKNYLLIAIRNLKKDKVFSLINILGLALGMACSLLILLWIQDERNKDKFIGLGITGPNGF